MNGTKLSPIVVGLLAVLVLFAGACGAGTGDDRQGGEAEAVQPDVGRDDDASPPDHPESASDDEPSVEEPAGVERPFREVEGVTTSTEYGYGAGLVLWEARVPAIEEVHISSTTDDREQPALWLAPGGDVDGDGPWPLLVVLHSWSYGYLQHTGVPFAQWAQHHGWGMIHPDFRGRSNGPEAGGSDAAVQDVVDAVDFAVDSADIDEDRVYVIGFSGGGQMSLLMAGRHADVFAGAVSFVPVHDLIAWHIHNQSSDAGRYRQEIEAVCGGDPTSDDAARDACVHRSPRTHLHDADIPIYIAHGLDDDVVPATHAVRSFNQLADPEDELSDEVLDAIGEQRLPERLDGAIESEPYFGERDPDVRFARRSGPVTLALFDGGHDLVYHPGLRWLYELAGGEL